MRTAQKTWRFSLHMDWGCLLRFAGLVAGVFFVAVLLFGLGEASQRLRFASFVAVVVFAALGLLMMTGPRLEVTPSEIRVLARWARAGSAPLPVRIPLQEIRIEDAAVVGLLAQRDLMPEKSLITGRNIGHGFPAGFYSLANGQHAIVLLSRWTGVLYLPTHAGTVWLMSLRHSQECLELLRTLCQSSTRIAP